jgi:hypothetical protein
MQRYISAALPGEKIFRRQAATNGFLVLQVEFQIAADGLGQFRMFVDEARDLLQQWIQAHALPEEFHVGETELR